MARMTDTRDLLVTTALNILLSEETALTLDAVSKQSGISKGGLIHHFPTKEFLIEGVVEELLRGLSANAVEQYSVAGSDALKHVQAHVEASLEPRMRQASAALARGLLRLHGSEFRKQSPFLDPWRRVFAKRLDAYRSSKDLDGFARAAVVNLAVESFLLIDVFQLYEFTDGEIQHIKHYLIGFSTK